MGIPSQRTSKHLHHNSINSQNQTNPQPLSHNSSINMHFQTIVLALAGASTAMAAALPGKSTLMDRQALLCSGASSTPLCRATDVLGIADLDCAAPPETPTDPDNFGEICAAIGQRARCCLLPILEQ